MKSLMYWVLLSFLTLSLNACAKKEEEKKEPAPKEVEMGDVKEQDVPIYATNFGLIRASDAATIVAQVSGVIEKYHFKEGSFVKKGDLLFTIDPRSYQAAYEQAVGTLKQQEASMAFAKDKMDRYSELVGEDFVSKLDYDQYVSEYEQAKASVVSAKASLESAKINLDYCYVKAPFDGRTGERLIDRGNLATANSTQLVSIMNINPIYVDFTLPEKYLEEILDNQAVEALSLEVTLTGAATSFKGVLDMVDNQVNTGTGSFKLRGVLENATHTLWPGQYVNVQVKVKTIEKAIVCPASAIQIGAKGAYAIVVKDGVAEFRNVTAGKDSMGLTIIKKGLSKGEKVITENVVFIRPGSKVVEKTKKKAEDKKA